VDPNDVLQALAKLSPAEMAAATDQLSPGHRDAIRAHVVRQAWLTGDLAYKWHATQKKIDAAIRQTQRRKFFALCSRRTGKSFYFLCRLFSRAIRQPGARLLYLAPFAKDAAEIANDIAVQLLSDCPEDLRPDYNSQTKEFVFKRTGSILRLKGVNNEHARQLRGGATDEIVLDECGQIDNLKTVVTEVVMPMTMTTGGLVLFATTPPETPDHDSREIYEDLAGDGSSVVFTIRDTPHVPDGEKFVMLKELGEDPAEIPDILAGTKSARTTAALREYFCEFRTDASKAVVPEFTPEAEREIVKEHPRPECYVAYTAMDPGAKDKTGILFAYWDWLNAKLVVEDELLLQHPSTPDIAKAIRETEAKHWPDVEPRRFLDSAGDGGLRLIADLGRLYKLRFSPARKDNAMAAIHLLRHSVASRELVIHPRCKHLIRQLGTAIWNNRATDFQRVGQNENQHHYDLVSALRYLVRSVDRAHNPYPSNYFVVGGKLGLPAGTWISPKRRKKDNLGLYADTPLGRRLAKLK
jgi:hypothetical protein